jgi:hypothetical protein
MARAGNMELWNDEKREVEKKLAREIWREMQTADQKDAIGIGKKLEKKMDFYRPCWSAGRILESGLRTLYMSENMAREK